MLSCLLVVAISHGNVTVMRDLSIRENVIEENAPVVMALEAGRRAAYSVGLSRREEPYRTDYGYDCGSGWVNEGIEEDEAFSPGY